MQTISRKRFTVDDYYKMLDVGILRPDEGVELIDGEVLQVSPMGPRHAATVYCIDRALTLALGDQAMVRAQLPLHVDEFNEPEPDIAVVRPRSDLYAKAHPNAADALLAVEVSDTTLGFDRNVKAPLYAIAGIMEYWIVDLGNRKIIRLREPEGDAYRTIITLGLSETISPIAFPEVRLKIADLLP